MSGPSRENENRGQQGGRQGRSREKGGYMSPRQSQNKILDDFFLSLGLCIIAVGVATYVLVGSWRKNVGDDGEKQTRLEVAVTKDKAQPIVKDGMRNKMRTSGSGESKIPEAPAAAAAAPQPGKDPQIESKLGDAVARIDRNDIRGAEPLLLEVLKMDPNNERALTEMAMIKLIDEHNPVEAIGYFERAVTVNPANETVMEELVNVYKDAGQLDQGADFLKKLSNANPDNIALERGVARTLVDLNRPEEAIPYLRRAAAASKEGASSTAYEELGDVYVEAGNLDGALDSYREALSNYDGNGEGAAVAAPQQKVMLGLKVVHALVGVGRRDDADEMLARMEQEDPHNEMIIAIRRELHQEQGM